MRPRKFKLRVGYALCSIGVASALLALVVDFSPLRWLWALLIGVGFTLVGLADYIETLEGASRDFVQALKKAPKKLRVGLGLLYMGLLFGALYFSVHLPIPAWLWGLLIVAGLTLMGMALEEKKLEKVNTDIPDMGSIDDIIAFEKRPEIEAMREAELEATLKDLRRTSEKDKANRKAK